MFDLDGQKEGKKVHLQGKNDFKINVDNLRVDLSYLQ